MQSDIQNRGGALEIMVVFLQVCELPVYEKKGWQPKFMIWQPSFSHWSPAGS